MRASSKKQPQTFRQLSLLCDSTSFSRVNSQDTRWGDRLAEPKPTGITRFVLQNINGLPAQNGHDKNDQLRLLMDRLQVDIMGISEVNLTWTKLPFSQRLHERTREWWEHRHISFSHNTLEQQDDPYLHGGVALLTRGDTAHRVAGSGQDKSGLGRWCWTRFRGRGGRHVRFIVAYRPVKNTEGPLSVYNQHIRGLLQTNREGCPRAIFIADLVANLEAWIGEGDQIILGVDANEDIRAGSLSIALQHLGLRETLIEKHGLQAPSTYQRGTRPIDGIYCSPSLQIHAGGYLGYGEGCISDHRPLWIDLAPQPSLRAPKDCLAPPRKRRLQCRDPRVVARFLKVYKQLIRASDLPTRVLHMEERADQDGVQLCQEWNNIDQLRVQAWKDAERKCRKFRMGRVAWSPQIQTAITRVIYWKLQLKRLQGGHVASKHLARMRKALSLSRSELSVRHVQESLQTAQDQYKRLKRDALELRQSWLESLALEYSRTKGGTQASHLRALRDREVHRREARTCRHILGSQGLSGVTQVVQQDPQGIARFYTEKEEIEQVCMDENIARFQQAADTPFLQAPLNRLVDPCATNQVAQSIRDGTWTYPPELDIYTQKLIHALQRPPRAAASPMNLTITIDDYAWHWRRSREHTASGRSGIHFGHLKAGVEDGLILELEAKMAQLPFAKGFSPARWRQGLDLAILKKPDNFQVEALRMLLLMEPDFNYLNKVLGYRLMAQAEALNLLAPEQYGSRRNRSAAEHATNKCLTFDLSRQLRQPLALCANDAKSCYDRIVWPVASLALQRLGVPIQPIYMMLSTFQQMKHYMLTQYGISSTYYDSSHYPSFHGVGQGNGAAPAIWAAVSSPLLNILREEGFGAKFQAPLTREALHIAGYAFVDDMDICQTVEPHSSTEDLISTLQANLNCWTGTLRATGGALVPNKSFWVLAAYKWKNGRWFYGSESDFPGQLRMQDALGRQQVLERVPPDEGRRTLGVRLSADGTNKAEVEYLRQCSLDWAARVKQHKLPRHLVWKALTTMLWPKLLYPLPATTLTAQQCRYIMAPALQVGLAASGIVGNLPRALTHGPMETFGLGIPHLYEAQGWCHITTAIKHGSHPTSITGRLLRCSIQLLKMELGLPGRLFELDYDLLHSLATDSWIKTLWRFLWEMDLNILETTPSLRLLRLHDQFLMDVFLQLGFRGGDLRSLNRCRTFLQVTSLADIASGCGRFISLKAREGRFEVEIPRQEVWPQQGQPPPGDWHVWKVALSRLCNSSSSFELPRHLGHWIVEPPLRAWLFSPAQGRLYRQVSPGCWVFHLGRSSRTGRSTGRRFQTQAQPLDPRHLPRDLQQGQASIVAHTIHFTGCSPIQTPTRPPAYTTLREAITSSTGSPWATRHLWLQADEQAFASALREGRLVAVSDGSYKDSHGVASWIIASVDGQVWGQGSLGAPGSARDQSALRSELAGIYTLVLILTRAAAHLHLASGSVLIGCDSIQALRLGFGTRLPSPASSNYDLVMAIRSLMDYPALTFRWEHIPAHQDRKAQGPLSLLSTLNIQADRAAQQFRTRPTEGPALLIEGEPWPLLSGENKFTSIERKAFLEYLQRSKGRQYWEKKKHLNPAQVQNIAWEEIGTALCELPLSRRLWAIKFAAGLCPVGKQMLRYRRWTHDRCPRCHQPEDTTHVLQCRDPEMAPRWRLALAELHGWMDQHHTDPVLRDAILSYLQSWLQLESNTQDTTQSSVSHILLSQQGLGDASFCQGFLVKDWADHQQQYLERKGFHRHGRRWLIQLIKKLWLIAWDFWEHRNDRLHRSDSLADQPLNEAIRYQLEMGTGDLPARARNWFDRN